MIQQISSISITQEPANSLYVPRSELNALILQMRQQLHDLSQPLTVLSATIDMIEAGFQEEEDLATAREALQVLFSIVSSLRTLPAKYNLDTTSH